MGVNVGVRLVGREGSTAFVIKGVSEKNLEFLDRLCELSLKTSAYNGMPFLDYEILVKDIED